VKYIFLFGPESPYAHANNRAAIGGILKLTATRTAVDIPARIAALRHVCRGSPSTNSKVATKVAGTRPPYFPRIRNAKSALTNPQLSRHFDEPISPSSSGDSLESNSHS